MTTEAHIVLDIDARGCHRCGDAIEHDGHRQLFITQVLGAGAVAAFAVVVVEGAAWISAGRMHGLQVVGHGNPIVLLFVPMTPTQTLAGGNGLRWVMKKPRCFRSRGFGRAGRTGQAESTIPPARAIRQVCAQRRTPGRSNGPAFRRSTICCGHRPRCSAAGNQ